MTLSGGPTGRRTLRMRHFDYTSCGLYFITVCTLNRALLFGDVVDGRMVLSTLGALVDECWRSLTTWFSHVSCEYSFVTMPNHFHGILAVDQPSQRTLGAVIAKFKGAVTARAQMLVPGLVVWQRNYYEHVIRSDESLARISEYIEANPANWHNDAENPARVGPDPLFALIDSLGRTGLPTKPRPEVG